MEEERGVVLDKEDFLSLEEEGRWWLKRVEIEGGREAWNAGFCCC